MKLEEKINIKNKNFKKKLINHINKISEKIQNIEKSNLISLSIFGSFSRGEMVYKKINNKHVFISDLDLLVIVKNKKNQNQIKKELSKINDLEIDKDIIYENYKEAKQMPLDTHTYDKSKALTIYGKEISQILPKVKKISKNDAEILFFNKLKLNLINLKNYEILKSKNKSDKISLSNQAAKMIFTLSDIINIVNNQYKSGVKERCDNAIKILKKQKNKKELINYMSEILEFYFDENRLYLKNPIEKWIKSRDYLIKTYENNKYSIKKNISFRNLIKKIIHFKDFYVFNPKKYLRNTLVYLLLSVENQGLNKNYLNKSKFSIEKLGYRIKSKNNEKLWNELRKLILKIGYRLASF